MCILLIVEHIICVNVPKERLLGRELMEPLLVVMYLFLMVPKVWKQQKLTNMKIIRKNLIITMKHICVENEVWPQQVHSMEMLPLVASTFLMVLQILCVEDVMELEVMAVANLEELVPHVEWQVVQHVKDAMELVVIQVVHLDKHVIYAE